MVQVQDLEHGLLNGSIPLLCFDSASLQTNGRMRPTSCLEGSGNSKGGGVFGCRVSQVLCTCRHVWTHRQIAIGSRHTVVTHRWGCFRHNFSIVVSNIKAFRLRCGHSTASHRWWRRCKRRQWRQWVVECILCLVLKYICGGQSNGRTYWWWQRCRK